MKHLITPLLLIMALLLCACGTEPVPDTTAPQSPSTPIIDIENMHTVPRQPCSMELNFAEELPAGSVIELLLNRSVVVTYTTEAATKQVRLTDEALLQDVSYALRVNGVMQQHSGKIGGRPGDMAPPPGEIPTPEQPSVPEAPAASEGDGFTPGDIGGISSIPPEGIPMEDLELPGDFLNGQLPPDPPEISGSLEIGALNPLPSEGFPGRDFDEMDPGEFRITGETTAFFGIAPAN